MKRADFSLDDPPVYRTRELPVADLAGKFFIASEVITATHRLSRDLPWTESETVDMRVWFSGQVVKLGSEMIFPQVIVPDAEHMYGRVYVKDVCRLSGTNRSCQEPWFVVQSRFVSRKRYASFRWG